MKKINATSPHLFGGSFFCFNLVFVLLDNFSLTLFVLIFKFMNYDVQTIKAL